MKSNEEYISDYLLKYTTLLKNGELWRLRVTMIEFIKEIERIREYGIEQRKSNYLNENHIQSNQNEMISVLLMDGMTSKELETQIKTHRETTKDDFAKDIPFIIERIKHIETPLKLADITKIYTWLSRKQITLDMLPKDVLIEFKETRQYRIIVNR